MSPFFQKQTSDEDSPDELSSFLASTLAGAAFLAGVAFFTGAASSSDEESSEGDSFLATTTGTTTLAAFFGDFLATTEKIF